MQAGARRPEAPFSGHLKGRIAEALVEAIFRRAGYFVSRIGRESQVQRLLKHGTDEFLPDFLVRKPVKRPETGRPLHRLIPVEVKYRWDLETFLRLDGEKLCRLAARHWPDLCLVLVTDNPEQGRSCFQVIDLWQREWTTTRDLHAVPDLEIYETTAREYEGLVREIFPLLDARVTVPDSEPPALEA